MHTYTYLHRQRALVTRIERFVWCFAQFLAAAAFLATPVKAQVGLGLTPMRLEFPATGGKAFSGTLSLSNSSAQPVRVRTEILDFYVDNNQTPQFLADVPAESEYSCRRWISVNPMEAEVGGRSTLAVRYTVRVPAEAVERSYHCAIGFVSVPTAEELKGFGVRTAVRVVSTLYPIVGKPNVKGSIAELTLESRPAGGRLQWTGVVVMENAGEMLYRPVGKVDVVDGGGRVLETLDIASFPVLPRRHQRFLLPLKQPLATGSYTLRARIDLGPEVQEASAVVAAENAK